MKKLIYNENTKEINVINDEQLENPKGGKRLRNWLKENKIFFEIFSCIFLDIMSIILSLVGLRVNKKTAEIYQEQLEILEDDREAYFILDYDLINEDIVENENEHFYVLKNVGGKISHANALIRKYVEIGIQYDKEAEMLIFRCPISRQYYTNQSISVYDEYNKRFVLSETKNRNKDIEKIQNDLISEISNPTDSDYFQGYSYMKTYIEVFYNNYQNERVMIRYEPYLNMVVDELDKEDDVIYLDESLDGSNIKSIAKKVQNEIIYKKNLTQN